MVASLVHILLSLLLAVSASKPCTEKRDVDVILEMPHTGREEASKQIKLFSEILAEKAAHLDTCWRPRIRVADAKVYDINTFGCFSASCISNGLSKLDANATTAKLTAKDNVIKALKNLTKEAAKSDVVPGLQGLRRLVLLVLSSKPERDRSKIPGTITSLLEGGYDFIAVGVGDGRYEALSGISFRKERILRIAKFSQLNADDDGNKNAEIMLLLGNPEYRDPTAVVAQRDYHLVVEEDDASKKEHCKFVFDICFLIDSSGSINPNDYDILKEFVIKIADRFNISENGSHAAAIVFSDHIPYSQVMFRLTDHVTRKSFIEAISKLPRFGYRTRIDIAFDLAANDVFTPGNGARENVTKIVFLLTDGRQNPNIYDALPKARELMDNGVKIFAVGITDSIDEDQLALITGESERVFYAETFHRLESKLFLKKVIKECCRAGHLEYPADAHCSSDPCQNGGTCFEENLTYSCICTSGYTGDNCQDTTNERANGTPVAELETGDPGKKKVTGVVEEEEDEVSECPKETGFCTKSNGQRQVTIGRKLKPFEDSEQSCFRVCQMTAGATGCEIAEKDVELDRTCYVHVNEVTGASGAPGYACWVFANCGSGFQRPQLPTAIVFPSEHPCDTLNRGGCLQTCHKVGHEAVCGCIEGFKLAADDKSCIQQIDLESTGGTPLPPKVVTEADSETADKSCVGSCTPGNDVYINIFQSGSGPAYVMQGLKIQQSSHGGSLTGVSMLPQIPHGGSTGYVRRTSEDELSRVLQDALPYRPKLVRRIEELVKNSKQEIHHQLPTEIGLPSLAAKVKNATKKPLPKKDVVKKLMFSPTKKKGKKRQKRSVGIKQMIGQEDGHDIPIATLAGEAGCNLFITALSKHRLLRTIEDLIEKESEVVIFCPVDSAYKQMTGRVSPTIEEKDILLNHIAFKHDRHGIMYKTLYPGGKISFSAMLRSEGKMSWKANGVDVIVRLKAGPHAELVITKDVLYPKTRGVADVMKDIDDVSTFYRMMNKFDLGDIFRAKNVKKVCFTDDKCVPLTETMQAHIEDAVSFKEFTIVAPADSMLANLDEKELTTLMTDLRAQKEFVLEHILVGSLRYPGNGYRGIAHSLSSNNSSLWMSHADADNSHVLVHRHKQWIVEREIPVSEGTLYVVGKAKHVRRKLSGRRFS